MLAIRLPEDIERRLDALAAATGRTKTFYARQAIVRHIDEIETEALAAKAAEEGDDPFGAFSEWDGAADRRAYAGL
ncbi:MULTISPECIES: type II toxin-antitoxin system RelB family antitoxin [Acetobacteraceae]|uniref:type II toxin-antitoxin system RelB family antitoxin n=1 Tax=Acetobacteraceae TaxID=433 RepID=UPI0014209043|nr:MULTISPECIES: TraY domain-containing protein [Acetobacteraceae]MCQ9157203.1 TraY domain-containing protein [Acidomonas methanolica]NIE81477.1 TraY domain-containing protein [Asaia sp. As-1742]